MGQRSCARPFPLNDKLDPTRGRERPDGASECSHGWSDGAAQPTGAEPVEGFSPPLSRPKGAKEHQCRGLSSAPGQVRQITTASTGSDVRIPARRIHAIGMPHLG